ncbi:FdhF/YdeP family oxidoreductase [Agrilutibacter solisilvae]|uniref:FdhF/YdeP family oxidoreductase n=1 Tax=Agrilutibacter solisilvae TaxID=2763317 RepID=A0A974Y0N8_9GAMM|nr:FdhF/YdeP family oxidoreductase [Lysobacter solisilvae]QSX79154.1 FdhF/YdeP family oxidoreductase [Lysobacter solisilvae]
MSRRTPIDVYLKPAGGWDALRSSWQALREQHVGMKGASTLLRTNQPAGFDCPGCAWPDRNAHSTFEFCENGVKAVANEATSRRVTREFFATHTVSALLAQDDHFLEAQGRLTEPMAYDASVDRYVPIGWDEAFARIAAALRGLDSPDQAVFYTSGRTSNEAAFLYQLFVREFGTNNLPDCSNMCHEPSGVALVEQLGSGKGSVTLEDFEHAQAIFIFGQNPGTNHPRMLAELRDAARRGCHIVAFNPLRERGLERFANPQAPADMLPGAQGVRIASEYYQPRIGGDLAVATAMAKVVVEQGAIDREFIDAHTQGFDAFARSVRAARWEDLENESGLTRAQLEQAARTYIGSAATIVCWGMGITQHHRSVATIQMLANLLLLRGNIGRAGAGPCPVRGHSNVQGDRTMGIYEKPAADFLDRLGAEFGFAPPRAHGFDTLDAIHAMHDGRARVFFGMGGNFAAATPDTVRTHAALRRCALTVQVSTKLNRSHLVHGADALILPCLGRTEIDLQAGGPQAVTVEDSMSMVHLSSGMNPPASDRLLSEPAIVARLAAATLPDSATPWLALVEDYDRIRERIARVVDGFEDFNARVRTAGGFHVHHPNRDRQFPNAVGKAVFHVHRLLPPSTGPGAMPDAPLMLMTVRSHDQYNTTIYGLDDRYRGVHGLRRVVFISAADLASHGYSDGDLVDLVSLWPGADGRVQERAVHGFRLVEYDIPPGCLAAYFPETNPLVPLESFAERARTPASKSIPVRLRASASVAAS